MRDIIKGTSTLCRTCVPCWVKIMGILLLIVEGYSMNMSMAAAVFCTKVQGGISRLIPAAEFSVEGTDFAEGTLLN